MAKYLHEEVTLGKLITDQPVKKLPALYGTQKLISKIKKKLFKNIILLLITKVNKKNLNYNK
jgi:hypothetical protein